MGPDRMSRNVGKELQLNPRNSSEERSSRLLRCGSLKSRIFLICPKRDGKIYRIYDGIMY